MTTFPDRPNTALLVVDVQNDVIADAWQPAPVIANIASLVAKARSTGTQVVWVQHSDAGMPRGSKEWELVPELIRLDGEPQIHKSYGDSFEDTDLEDVLATGGVGRLVVVGAETDVCIRSTIHGGFARGYDVTLVGDAHTGSDKSDQGAPPAEKVIAHTNLYWQFQRAPERTAAVVATGDVDFTA